MQKERKEDKGADPVISVLIVTYRQADTLGRAIESVLEQKVDVPFEIIVADDSSGDGTAEVGRRYAEKYPGKVRLIVNERNLGVQGNYFNALLGAKGEYMADCAGDDFWCDPLKLQKELDVMRGNPDVTLVHTGFEYYRPDGSRMLYKPKHDSRRPVTPGKKVLRRLVAADEGPLIHLCTSLYRRDCVAAAIKADREFFYNPEWGLEDLQIAAACAAAGDIAFIPDTTLCYSVGHDSISSEGSMRKNFDFYYGTLALRLRMVEKFGLEGEDIDRGIARRHDFVTSQARHARYREGFRKLKLLRKQYEMGIPLKSRVHQLLFNLGI